LTTTYNDICNISGSWILNLCCLNHAKPQPQYIDIYWCHIIVLMAKRSKILMTILDHYGKEKQRFLENCVQCGLCAEECPILPHTDVSEISSQDIQEGVFDCIDSGIPNQQAYTKAFACMECFKCTADICPEDLNPMLVNELIKGEYISHGLAEKAYGDQQQPNSVHRILASVQVSASDYLKITKSSNQKHARYVFFPGCNVYFQPEAVVLWCPTCQCRFDKSIAPALDVPFRVLSFPQYLAANMNKLTISDAVAGIVTLHEPYKSAYTGLDRDGPREVLRQLPGVTLMERMQMSISRNRRLKMNIFLKCWKQSLLDKKYIVETFSHRCRLS